MIRLFMPSTRRGESGRLYLIDKEPYPKIAIPVLSMDRCVCCPDKLLHGEFCRVTYRYAGKATAGVFNFVRVWR